MKKTILIVLGVILGIVVVSGTTYMITKNLLDKGEQVETTHEDDKQENNSSENNQNNNEQQSKPTPVTLTEEELIEYLNYVPVETQENVYANKSKTINDVDKKELLIMAIEYATKDNNSSSIETDIIDKNLKKMYNLSYNAIAPSLNINEDELLNSKSGSCYELPKADRPYYTNGQCSEGFGITHLLEDYKINNDSLEIYEYAAKTRWGNILEDSYNDFKDENVLGENTSSYEEYIKQNKDKFTLYKNTFKKNDTGYYWYSTEVVEG